MSVVKKIQDLFLQPLLSSVFGKKFQVEFSDPDTTSDAGTLLLREVEQQTKIIENASRAIIDRRNPSYIKHTRSEMVAQRVMQIACGYEDANDCDTLNNDPAYKIAAGREVNSNPLASQPTMSRLENDVSRTDLMRMAYALGKNFLNGFSAEPNCIIIDMDPTINKTYGDQQLTLFNGYADEYCLMPFHVYDGITGQMITTVLRPGTTPTGTEIVIVLRRIVKIIRQRFPKTKLIFRADSHHCRPEVLDYCHNKKVNYTIGLSQNSKLNKLFNPLRNRVEKLSRREMQKVRHYKTDYYKAGSWSRACRVVCRAEGSASVTDLRYVVTDMNELSNKNIYDVLYSDRGNAELMIKDSKLGLKSDRMSCHRMEGNQFRLLLAGLAYQLMHSLRSNCLRGTNLARAEFATIRLKLLKVGGRFICGKTFLRVHLPKSCPVKNIYARIGQMVSTINSC
jgi:hypothetical protein